MRIAIGCLIALAVAYTSMGESEEKTAPCPQAACAKACEKASACDKTKSGETAAACPTAQACKAVKSCDQAKTCETKTGETVAACAKSKDCADASACATACAKSTECDAAKACAVAANVLNATTVSASACNKETACNKEPACCKQAAVATACAEKKACAQATATACAEKGACPLTASCPEVIAAGAESECAAGNCCKKQACPATAEATDQIGAPCAKLAVASDADCPGEALVEVSDCCVAGSPATACNANVECGTTQLAHLAKAAEHLTAAGLADEAASVRAMSVKLCQELVAQKTAQIASLQAEIATLEAGCDAMCLSRSVQCEAATSPVCRTHPAPIKVSRREGSRGRVNVHVKIVEIDPNKMERLGISFPPMTRIAAKGAPSQGVCFGVSEGDGFLGDMDTLERKQLATVVTAPRVELRAGQKANLHFKKLDAQIDVTPRIIGDEHVRIDARPRLGQFCHPIDCGVEMKLGQTAVITGATSDSDGNHERVLLFLITPVQHSDVKPASHTGPSEKPASTAAIRPFKATTHRIHASGSFSIDPSKPLPKIIFTSPAEADE